MNLEPPKLAFRPDIEGLRALAIAAVLLYHADLPWAPGGYIGVDMFFVISGFLITRLLVREVEETGTVSLKVFYGRRMKRLLPATAFLLIAVVVLATIVYSPLEQEETAWDVVASGAYFINWRLASGAVDYFAAGLQASPVQHFWSLAVEEQFYIVWPVLLLAIGTVWRKGQLTTKALRARILTVILLLAVASFAYNLYLTQAEAGVAYFSTFTRGWEFILGALLALIRVHKIGFRRTTASFLAWGGIAALAWSVLNLGDQTPFPGAVALIPTLGTAAVILAGFSEEQIPLSSALGAPVMQHIGRLSYSWYLWHWPLLVFAAAAWGELSGAAKLLIVGASYVPALLTHRWVEKPVHHHGALKRSPSKALLVGAGCTAVSVSLGLFFLSSIPKVPEATASESPGGEFVKKNKVPEQKEAHVLRPRPDRAYEDSGPLRADGCQAYFREVEPKACVYGDEDSKTSVVLFGDSLAGQFFPAVQHVGEKEGWRMIGLTKGGCSPARYTRYLAPLKRVYTECDEWRELAIEKIEEEKPDMIIVSGQVTVKAHQDGENLDDERSAQIVEDGYVSTLETLKDTGAKIVVIRDGPHPPEDVPECISEAGEQVIKCAFDRAEALDFAHADVRAAKRVGDVTVIDTTPVLCNKRRCPAVIGNVLVYRQSSHLTATYVETLAKWFERKLPPLR